jgi:hypothetical protein
MAGPAQVIIDPTGRYGAYVEALGETGAEVNGNGFVVSITFERVMIDGSPVIFHFNPPIANVDQISPPALLAFVIDQINNHGAVVQGV